jgi:hypothetical protein
LLLPAEKEMRPILLESKLSDSDASPNFKSFESHFKNPIKIQLVQNLKKEFSNAFFIYDLYKFLLPHQKKLKNSIVTEISYFFEPTYQGQNEDTIRYYLTIMKEFIHGSNKKDENNSLKATYDSNLTDYEPKYKNLITGKSYIAKSNNEDLINSLGI